MTTVDGTNWTVLQDAASGDQAARAEFFRRYRPAVRAYLTARWKRTVLSGQVEDGVSDVFLAFLRPGSVLDGGLDRLRGESFRAYLYGLTRNVARMIERGQYRKREVQAATSFDFQSLEASEVEFSAVKSTRNRPSIRGPFTGLDRETRVRDSEQLHIRLAKSQALSHRRKIRGRRHPKDSCLDAPE